MLREKTPRVRAQMPMVFIFLLIGLFAASSLTLTLIGMRVYRDVAAEAESNGDAQMLLSYVGNKVHAYDAAGGVAIEAARRATRAVPARNASTAHSL